MDFDIAVTSTLQAVASSDERQLADDLQRRLADALSQAEEHAQVTTARAELETAERQLDRLRRAERTLSECARSVREQTAEKLKSAIHRIVESAADSASADFSGLEELEHLESRSGSASRAIQEIVEHLIPVAEIAYLREDSHCGMTRARVLEAIAQERAERVLEQLRGAVTDEVVLPVDMSKGVSGALLAEAAELKRRAVQASENADRREHEYLARRGGTRG